MRLSSVFLMNAFFKFSSNKIKKHQHSRIALFIFTTSSDDIRRSSLEMFPSPRERVTTTSSSQVYLIIMQHPPQHSCRNSPTFVHLSIRQPPEPGNLHESPQRCKQTLGALMYPSYRPLITRTRHILNGRGGTSYYH